MMMIKSFLLVFCIIYSIHCICLDNPSDCLTFSNATLVDNSINVSQYSFSFLKGDLFGVTEGILRYYRLTNGQFTLVSEISYGKINQNSSVSKYGNDILVGSPLNDTAFEAYLFNLQSNTYQLVDTIMATGNENCLNVGKSVIIYSGGLELVLGGDSCILFYYYNQNTSSWDQKQNLVFDGSDLTIGNDDNLISGSGAFVGYREFGQYLVSTLYCRNDAEASWGPCLQRLTQYGNIASNQIVCENDRVFWVTSNTWGSFDLQYILYGVERLTVIVTQIDLNLNDINIVASNDCNTIAYNYKDPDTSEVTLKVLNYNSTSTLYETAQVFDHPRRNTDPVTYIIDNQDLYVNVQPLTSQLVVDNVFV